MILSQVSVGLAGPGRSRPEPGPSGCLQAAASAIIIICITSVTGVITARLTRIGPGFSHDEFQVMPVCRSITVVIFMVDIAKKLEWCRAEIHAAADLDRRPGSSAAMDILQIWKLFGHNDASNDKKANDTATELRPIKNQSIDEINVSNEGGLTGIGLILNKRESEDGYDTYVCEVLSGGSALLSGKVLVI